MSGGRPRLHERVERTCVCGATFTTTTKRIEEGRGKHCSKACSYANRTRRSGLKYVIRVHNRAWIKPGQRLSPESEFKPGERPHNWKGDAAGYDSLHDWVRRHRGRAQDQPCEQCGDTERRHEWANLSHEYRRDLDDWAVLCKPCHGQYDRGHLGAIARRFGKAS